MSKVFTHKHFFVLCCLLSSAAINTLSAQCSFVNAACAVPIRDDFNADAAGFTGTGGFNYVNSAGSGNFQATTQSSQTGYTITTRNFSVGAAATSASIGFTLSGVRATYSVTVQNAANATLRTCTTTLGGNNLEGEQCVTITDPALAGQNVRFIITFTTVSGNQGEGILTFDNFRTNLAEQVATPVTFTSFDAKKLAAGTQLTWKVGVEENVSHYEIERSNGSSYMSVGSVPASGQSSYSFTDPQANGGTALYRIRSIDKDGQYKYSTIISLKNGVASVLFKAFPIPAGNTLTVQHPAVIENGKITIAGSDGRTVKSVLPAKGSMQTDIKLDGLNSGIYLLRFNRGNGELQTMKIIKQ